MTKFALCLVGLSLSMGFFWGLLGRITVPRIAYENHWHCPTEFHSDIHAAQQPILYFHMEYQPAVGETPDGRKTAMQTKRLEINVIPVGAHTWL